MWKVTQEPEYLPLSLVDAKAYLRVQHSADDDLITDCIRAATSYCEEELDLAIMDQEITLKLDSYSANTLYLPRANLLSVTSVTYTDENGDSQPFADFVANEYTTPASVYAATWPTAKDIPGAGTIVYRAGYRPNGAGVVAVNPAPGVVIQAIKLLITHFYDNRTPVFVGAGAGAEEIAITVTALLHKFRRLGV